MTIPGEPEHVQLPPPERLSGGDIALPSLLVHQDLVSLKIEKFIFRNKERRITKVSLFKTIGKI